MIVKSIAKTPIALRLAFGFFIFPPGTRGDIDAGHGCQSWTEVAWFVGTVVRRRLRHAVTYVSFAF
jgi:hypothetical protein